MAGRGVGAPRPRPQAQASVQPRRRRHQAASLPIDVIAAIAARSDPATLVRCAATCGDMRGRVADPGFRLRLRHADHRFVPSLLRGILLGDRESTYRNDDQLDMYLLDATAGSLRRAAESFAPGEDGEPLELYMPLSAREGLVLVRDGDLHVCNLATGRFETLPPEPEFGGLCVLLVGDGVDAGGGAVGRPFQVVKASLVLEEKHRRLVVQTFSSELGTPLVAGGAVHWLCFTDTAAYVLKLRVRSSAAAAPRLAVTKLPERFPYNGGKFSNNGWWWWIRHLLVTMAPGGSPAVLVADKDKITAWTQSKHSARWNQQPQVAIECKAISRFLGNVVGEEKERQHMRGWDNEQATNLVGFAERSGIVLIKLYDCFFCLNLQSKQIVSCFLDPSIRDKDVYCPYEMDISNWVPSFSAASF
ncbi:hypothetical protein HU200_045757 [Digitaria exilis]|uniref:DUF7595 domain-containing protein n=1 Tax=Digitaria exilis TaxID=1010633 RepID=A0A835EFG2_9POAL|nr:hypothetical protein HU200_045757 [Digitaria exilis]